MKKKRKKNQEKDVVFLYLSKENLKKTRRLMLYSKAKKNFFYCR